MANYSPKYAKIGLFPFSDGCFLSEKNMLKKGAVIYSIHRKMRHAALYPSEIYVLKSPFRTRKRAKRGKNGVFLPLLCPFSPTVLCKVIITIAIKIVFILELFTLQQISSLSLALST